MKIKVTKLRLGILAFLFFLTTGTGEVQAEPYGWSPSVDNSWAGTPTCTDSKPDKAPILLQPNHPALPKKPKPSEVVLYWHKVPGATGYNIYYGLSPKNYIYSVADVTDTNNFTIGKLANKTYYFAVQAKKGCAAGALSKEWKVRPGQGGYIVRTGTATNVYGATTVNKITPITNKVTKPSVTSQPSQPPSVKGAQTGTNIGQPTNKETQYNPPQASPTTVQVKPKPKGLWETILSILFGR